MSRGKVLARQLLVTQLAASSIVLSVMFVVTGFYAFDEVLVAQSQFVGLTARTVARDPLVEVAVASPESSSSELEAMLERTRDGGFFRYVAVGLSDGRLLGSAGAIPDDLGARLGADDLAAEVADGSPRERVAFDLVEDVFERRIPVVSADGEVVGVVVVGRDVDYLLGRFTPLLAAIAVQYLVAGGGVTLLVMLLSTAFRRRMYSLTPEEVASVIVERESLLAGMADGVIAVAPDRTVTLVNDAAEKLTSIRRDLVVGHPANEVLPGELIAAIEGPDGVERLLLIGEAVLLARVDAESHRGKEGGRMLVLRDRSELARVLDDLEGAESTTKALRARNHEFSNTLQVIAGLIQLGRFDAAQGFIAREGRGGDIVTGPMDDGIEDWELVGLLQASRARATELGILLEVDALSSIPNLAADPETERVSSDLVTVVGNLVRNALEACSDGDTVSVLVEWRSCREGQGVGDAEDRERAFGGAGGAAGVLHAGDATIDIVVSDDGPGIPRELRGSVFASGFTSKSAEGGGTHGRGIGLALVERIAHRYAGFATVDDSAAGGARFVVRLVVRRERGGAGEERMP